MPRSRRQFSREIPKPAIADVLTELGAESVPTGYGWVRMRCPFHEDRTPSAAVNHDAETGGFRCHSCGRHGDGLKLLMTELGLSFPEACERASALSPCTTTGRPVRKRRASDLLKGMQ